MNLMIRSNALKRLANGEFAVLDSELRWRFFREETADECPAEVRGTPDRFSLLSEAACAIPLHDCPEAFKSGFVRAMYETPVRNAAQLPAIRGVRTKASVSVDLKWMLFVLGFMAGAQAKRCEAINPTLYGSSAPPGTFVL